MTAPKPERIGPLAWLMLMLMLAPPTLRPSAADVTANVAASQTRELQQSFPRD